MVDIIDFCFEYEIWLVEFWCVVVEIVVDVLMLVKDVINKLIWQYEFDLKGSLKFVGCVGCQLGNVLELMVIVDLKLGVVEWMWCIFDLMGGSFDGVQKVLMLYDMCFVFLENNIKILFVIVYDGDWDIYINDFVIKILDLMDLLFVNVEGWFGIVLFDVKDFIVSYQIDVVVWFVVNLQVIVVDVCCLQCMLYVLDVFLDIMVENVEVDFVICVVLIKLLVVILKLYGVDY